ncbi:hypothetical protein FA95DRAFT_116489 [Auriscalpium vulgare]|uniref:Uncharacterized protein n=1 Tax=Auriscalpium vulgare TaxID=40419 RepID=A0ACB8RPM4_9AGAM|nr:hypothetical protein FA95DRAFT_116489 [Auriscalpium vulgare]
MDRKGQARAVLSMLFMSTQAPAVPPRAENVWIQLSYGSLAMVEKTGRSDRNLSASNDRTRYRAIDVRSAIQDHRFVLYILAVSTGRRHDIVSSKRAVAPSIRAILLLLWLPAYYLPHTAALTTNKVPYMSLCHLELKSWLAKTTGRPDG